MSPIDNDGALQNDYAGALETDEEAANAFLTDEARQEDDASKKKKPSEKGTNEPKEQDDADEDDAETSDESPEETDESDEGEDQDEEKAEDKKYAESDDIYVKVKVGDEEHEVPVKDLKRLFGQEAALTRKSQEVAQERNHVQQQLAKNIASYDVMLKRATERADQYRNIPWVALTKDPTVSAEQVQALQAEAQRALEDERFLKAEIDGFMGQVTQAQAAERAKSAQECIKALTTEDSPHHIKGWGETLYNDLRSFGVEMGLHKDMVNTLTDPAAFKLLHMAMQFKRGASKVQTTKVNKTPKKIVKTSAAPSATKTTSKTIDRNKAVSKLKQTGSMDDAEAAFMSMFQGD